MTHYTAVYLIGPRDRWMLWEAECVDELSRGAWGPAVARAMAVTAWQGESIRGELRHPEPPGLDIGDPRRSRLSLYLPAHTDPPLRLTPLLCVREDLADLARSIGIVIHPFDRVAWYRVPQRAEAIERGSKQWPKPNKSWVGQHPEVERGARPLYCLGVPPRLPFVPGSRKHLFGYIDIAHDRSEVQLDPDFLSQYPVCETPGALVMTNLAPQPFLDLVADEEHFKVLKLRRKS